VTAIVGVSQHGLQAGDPKDAPDKREPMYPQDPGLGKAWHA